MKNELQKSYLRCLAPVLVLLLAAYVLKMDDTRFSLLSGYRALTAAMLIVSALSSLILPMWFKIFTLKRMIAKNGYTDEHIFMSFQKRYLKIAFVSVYLIPLSYLISMDRIPMTAIVIMGFYAAYYYYPSKLRMDSEKRVFRFKGQGDEKAVH